MSRALGARIAPSFLRTRGYEARIWPARYTNGLGSTGEDIYEGRLAPLLRDALVAADPKLIGKPTDSERFSDLDLNEREASYGRSGFALQFMLDTTLSDANRYPLKLRDLIVMDLNSEIAPVQVTWASGPEQIIEGLPNVGLNGDRYHRPMYTAKDFAPYQGAVLVVDPSGRGKDETAYAVVKMLNGMLYVTRWGGIEGGYDEAVLRTLATIALDQKVTEVVAEGNFGDGMFNALFEPILNSIYPVTLSEINVRGQKEVRIIDTLEPVMNQHRLVIDKALVEEDCAAQPGSSGLWQATHLTRDRGSLAHDDRIDVLSLGVAHWLEYLKSDVRKSEKSFKDKLMDKELRKFAKGVLGRDLRRNKSFV